MPDVWSINCVMEVGDEIVESVGNVEGAPWRKKWRHWGSLWFGRWGDGIEIGILGFV